MKKSFLIYLPMFIVGTANAKDIALTWDDSTITAPTSCSYGGTFTPPTPDERPGYVFTGWRVKATHAPETCGVPSLNSSINGDSSYDAQGYVGISGTRRVKADIYGLGNGEWARVFSYGAVYGRATCNTTYQKSRGTVKTNMSPGSSGKYCWCQVIGFTPTRDSYSSGPQCRVRPLSYSWVYEGDAVDASNCDGYCPYYCNVYIQSDSNFRKALFQVAGQ